MDWNTILPVMVNIGVLVGMWWRLDAKFDAKFETVNRALLTLSHDVGELKGQISALLSKA